MPRFSQTGSFECPHCGANVPSGSTRCRQCGASNEYDWGETDGQFAEGGFGDDDDFDYDEFVAREFGSERNPATDQLKQSWLRVIVLAVVIALLLPLILQLLA